MFLSCLRNEMESKDYVSWINITRWFNMTHFDFRFNFPLFTFTGIYSVYTYDIKALNNFHYFSIGNSILILYFHRRETTSIGDTDINEAWLLSPVMYLHKLLSYLDSFVFIGSFFSIGHHIYITASPINQLELLVILMHSLVLTLVWRHGRGHISRRGRDATRKRISHSTSRTTTNCPRRAILSVGQIN